MAILCKPMELALPQSDWDKGLRQLLFEPDSAAAGDLRRLPQSQGCRLIAERLEVVPKLPQGVSRPPMSDWLVLVVDRGHGETIWTPARLIGAVSPRASQGVAAVVVRPGRAGQSRVVSQSGITGEASWEAAWFEDGQISPIDAVQIVGPGMLRLERAAGFSPAAPPDAAQAATSDADVRRWSRTVGPVGARAFHKLRQSSVTLAGCGRNGSAAAFQFAALGVPMLRLIDADTLEIENMDAMPGLTTTDVGRPKVEALAERLIAFRPDLAVTCIARSVTDGDVLADLGRMPAELVVSAVDHDAARLAMSLLAREALMPHLDFGTSIQRAENGELLMSGDARLLLPGQGCAACVGGLAEQEEALYELAAPPNTLRRGMPSVFSDQRLGSLVTLNGLTVSACMQLWLDLLAGKLRTSFWQRLRWVPGQGIEAHGGPVGPGAVCPFCRAG